MAAADTAFPFFEGTCPEDVLLLLFECLSTRDVMALSSMTRAVHRALLPKSTAGLPTQWARAARTKLRQFLPAGPLFSYKPFYAWNSNIFDTLGGAFPEFQSEVAGSAGSLYAALALALDVPIADVASALEYTFRSVNDAEGPHAKCIMYTHASATPVRDKHLAPLPAFAPASGLELFKCISVALTCNVCGVSGAAERQCAHCGALVCSGCSSRCSRDRAEGCAFALCPGCNDEAHIDGRPEVYELDESLGLAQPLCEMCGDDIVCVLHQCHITSQCDACSGKRCNEHVLDYPAMMFCAGGLAGCLGRHCERGACAPAAGSIEHCQRCYSSFCAACFPRMLCPGVGGVPCPGGCCVHCSKSGACPVCGQRG